MASDSTWTNLKLGPLHLKKKPAQNNGISKSAQMVCSNPKFVMGHNFLFLLDHGIVSKT